LWESKWKKGGFEFRLWWRRGVDEIQVTLVVVVEMIPRPGFEKKVKLAEVEWRGQGYSA